MKINLIPNNYKVVDFYEEIWRNIEGYEGLYQISNIGRVRSLDREVRNGNGKRIIKGQILKSITKRGYITVTFYRDNKCKNYCVHRLVAEAFIPNPENKPQIDHINTIRDDNRVVNLRWVTRKENMRNPLTHEKMTGENHPFFGKHHTEETRKKLSETNSEKVICIETGQVFDSMIEAGEIMGVFPTSISAVCRGKNKTSGGFHWAYYPCSEEEMEKKLNEGIGNNKKVVCVETGQVFDSLTKASECVGVSKSSISECCTGKQKTCGGFHWKYYEKTSND